MISLILFRCAKRFVFWGKIPQRKVTKRNTYNHSFFFTIVSLQFSKKFCFSGCLFLIANSKLVISVGKRGGLPRRLCFLIRELFRHKKIAVKAKFFRLPRFLSLLISLQFRKKISPSGDFHSNENHRLLDKALIPIQDLNTNFCFSFL